MPDAFGNISQMPQILSGFGIDNAVFGRGITPVLFGCGALPEYPESFSELKWSSPDGSSVLGVQMTCWYDNARELPTDKEALQSKLERLSDVMSMVQSTPYYLGMNGCDHQPLQKDLPEAVRLANELGYPLEISNLERYLQDVRPYADTFFEVVGELNGQKTCGYGNLKNTASARVYIKQLNYQAEYMLNSILEPLYTMNHLKGGMYDRDYIDYLWKTLLKNYPHDSICCCSVDQVIKDMEGRFHSVIDTCEMAIEDVSRHFVSKESVFNSNEHIVVYNLQPFEKTEWLEVEVMFANDCVSECFHIVDGAGNEIPFEELDRTSKKVYELPDDRFRVIYERTIVKIRMKATLEGFGYKVFKICPCGAQEMKPLIRYENGQLETEQVILTINPNGSFNLLDKRNQQLYKNQNVYEYAGDIGNEYNSFITDTVITTEDSKADVSVCMHTYYAEVTIRNEMKIPKNYDRETGLYSGEEILSIETVLRLDYDANGVQISTRFVNNSENYRLRALFNYDCKNTHCTADTPFDMTERSLIHGKEWENPCDDERMTAFVEYADELGGIVVSGHGIHEYEVVKDKKVFGITLLRAIDIMGDWFHFPTPDAQCKGETNVTYQFIPLLKEHDEQGILAAYDFYKPALYAQSCAKIKENFDDEVFFAIKRNGIVNCSTVKRANDDGGYIIRLSNPSNTDALIQFDESKALKIFYCNLDETIIAKVQENTIKIPAKKIVTLKLV